MLDIPIGSEGSCGSSIFSTEFRTYRILKCGTLASRPLGLPRFYWFWNPPGFLWLGGPGDFCPGVISEGKGKAQAGPSFGLTAGQSCGHSSCDAVLLLEASLTPGFVLAIRERSALNAAAIAANGKIDVTLYVKMAKKADGGRFFAATAPERDPLI